MIREEVRNMKKSLTAIKIDDETLSILASKNLTLDSVLPDGEVLFLKDSANLSTGGTARDVTASVHPYNIFPCRTHCTIDES